VNLNENPTVRQLAGLLKVCDDMADHHVLWVDRNGNVAIDRDADFDRENFHGKFYMETFDRGNKFVGPDASKDEKWLTILFTLLINNWNQGSTDYVEPWSS
jgi:hypothetical protein